MKKHYISELWSIYEVKVCDTRQWRLEDILVAAGISDKPVSLAYARMHVCTDYIDTHAGNCFYCNLPGPHRTF